MESVAELQEQDDQKESILQQTLWECLQHQLSQDDLVLLYVFEDLQGQLEMQILHELIQLSQVEIVLLRPCLLWVVNDEKEIQEYLVTHTHEMVSASSMLIVMDELKTIYIVHLS